MAFTGLILNIFIFFSGFSSWAPYFLCLNPAPVVLNLIFPDFSFETSSLLFFLVREVYCFSVRAELAGKDTLSSGDKVFLLSVN